MRYLTQFQYLSYRKVSLLYLVFILFYFFTASKEEMHNFKQLNQAVFERLTNKEGERKWQDSTAAVLGLANTASVLNYSDPSFEKREWGTELTTSLNQNWKIVEQDDDRSLLSATEKFFNNQLLPIETPNVVSSTLLALESLRQKRKFRGEKISAQDEGPSAEELFGPVKLQLKSVFLPGEHMQIAWPIGARSELYVYRNNTLLEQIAPGESMDRILTAEGHSRYVFTDGEDSLVQDVEVLATKAYEFAFGKRYYHLTSGHSYVLSLHNQLFSQSNTEIQSSNDQVMVQWIDDNRIRVNTSKDYFSGTALIRFRSSQTDSLRLRFSPEESFLLGMAASNGQPTSDINQCELISLSNGSNSLAVIKGDLVVFHEKGSSRLSVSRGRLVGSGYELNKAVGIMLENGLILDEDNDRISLEHPVIQWLN